MIVHTQAHVCDRCKRQAVTDFGRPEGWREIEERDTNGVPTRTHLCAFCSPAFDRFLRMGEAR